ncbi:Rrf2 family transcriptional regulator [Thermodesulfobacteriota bacterium]
MGSIVALLEEGKSFVPCSTDPETCPRADYCGTRELWEEAARAMYEKLNTITLRDMLDRDTAPASPG